MEVMDVEFTEASQRRRQHNETTHRLGTAECNVVYVPVIGLRADHTTPHHPAGKSIIAGATIDFTDSLDQDIIGAFGTPATECCRRS